MNVVPSVRMFAFSTRGNVIIPPPRVPPKPFGDYCWKATCTINDANNLRVAAFMGYDADMMGITGVVLKECEKYCKIYGGTCEPPELLLLSSTKSLECSGQIFFTLDGTTKQIV